MQLREYERIDDLQIKNLRLIQDKRGFCFGTDAVMLASFADIKKGDKVLDMCSGNGIIPVLLTAKTEAGEIYGIEIQPEAASLAKRNVELNSLSNVFIIKADIKDALGHFNSGYFDHVTCNPPYIKAEGGKANPADAKAIARHEVLCTLDDVVKTASQMLRFGGKFSMVHRPDRLSDIITTLRKYRLEPKRLRFIHSEEDGEAVLVLIESTLGGGSFLKVMPPLVIYDKNGGYTQEYERIYRYER